MSDDGAEARQSRAGVPPNGGMETLFGKVWDVLVRHAGAAEGSRSDFIRYHVHAAGKEPLSEEWRFMGSLGMGGKFYCESSEIPPNGGTFRVGCYLEDRNSHRDAVCKSTNEALKPLYIEFRRARGAMAARISEK